MSLQQAIKRIEENYSEIQNKAQNSEYDAILAQATELIKVKTDNFLNSEGISQKKSDITELLKNSGVNVGDWVSTNKTTQWSEADSVIGIANSLDNQPKSSDSSKTKKLKLFKLKAKALVLMQKQRIRTK